MVRSRAWGRAADAGVLAVIALAAAVAAVAAVHVFRPLAGAEARLDDIRVAYLTPYEDQNPHIVILQIDEATLSGFPYRSPIDRGFLANVVTILGSADARAIGMDILFDRPTEAAKDAALQQALRDARIPVVVATAGPQTPLTRAQADYHATYLAAVTKGFANLTKDGADGVVRTAVPRQRDADGVERLSFPAALARAAGAYVPDGPFAIAYRRGPDDATPAFKAYPANAVALLPKDWFTDKIVLIGTDLDDTDRHRTPMDVRSAGGLTSGVTIHAQVLAQMLDGRGLVRLGPAGTGGLALIAALAGIALALVPLRTALTVLLAVVAGAGYWVGAFAVFQLTSILLPILAPTLSFAGALGLGTAYAGRKARAQRRYIRDAFSRYVSPSIVARLEHDPSRLELGGERRDMSFVFTDLAGFTSLCERTDPVVFVPVLNSYLEGMVAIVLGHEGTIDKIVGDAVVAFFGAPEDQPDHHVRAVRCALALDAFAQDYAAKARADGIDLGVTRIGVHSGPATIGNFGGSTFFDYTAHGDAVNTAARLESVNKHIGTRICVSGETAAHCDGIAFRPIGDLVLKGKEAAIATFEPVPVKTNGYADSRAYAAAYEGLANGGGASAFDALSQSAPDDPLVRFHAARIAAGETGTRIVFREK